VDWVLGFPVPAVPELEDTSELSLWVGMMGGTEVVPTLLDVVVWKAEDEVVVNPETFPSPRSRGWSSIVAGVTWLDMKREST
jgi:hypothetical protein